MLWQLFIVLVVTVAASENDSEEDRPNCMILVRHECEAEEKASADDFPRNEEELEEFCKITLEYVECSDRVLSSCDGEYNDYGRYLKDVSANVRRVCNEDAILRTAVVENLPCFQDNWFEIQVCDEAFNRNIEAYRDSFSEIMNEIGVTDAKEDDSRSPRCLDVIFGAGCAAATAAEICGNTARDVIINIVQGLDTIFEACPPGLKERLPEIAEGMQMEAEKVKSVEKTLKKK